MLVTQDDYAIDDDPARLDLDVVQQAYQDLATPPTGSELHQDMYVVRGGMPIRGSAH